MRTIRTILPVVGLNVLAIGAAAGAVPAAPAGGGAGSAARAAEGAVNIIFILADDIGYGDVGCYGQKEIKTPNIDKLAAEGMRFTDAYAGGPVCAPSRCALMTGLNTGHAKLRGDVKINLGPADTTVAELLHGAGYQTMLAGKWGLAGANTTGTPEKKGFDLFYGFLDQTHAHNSYTDFLYRNGERVTLKNVVPNPGAFGQGVATVQVEFTNDLFDQEITKYIQHVDAARPFFVYAAFTIPHANNVLKLVEVPDLGEYATKPWPDAERRYAAAITRVDTYVGNVVRELKARKLEDRTLIVFSSDNGPHEEGSNKAAFFQSSGVLRGIKRDLYEGGIREPFVAWWPGHVPAGVVTGQPVAFWDFLPTAMVLAKAQTPKGLDGVSILPTLLGHPQEQTQHEFFYWEFHERGFEQAVRVRGTAESGDWKAVRHGSDRPLELYSLKTDISEKQDVAAAHPEIVAKVTEYLKTARVDSLDFPVRNRPAAPARGAGAAGR